MKCLQTCQRTNRDCSQCDIRRTDIPLDIRARNIRNVKIGFVIFWSIMFGLLILIEGFKIRPQCPLHYFTSLSCPFCGLTRLFEALFKFDVIQAFRWNPFMFVQMAVAPFVLYFALKQYIRNSKFDNKFKVTFYCWLGMAVVFAIVRNTQMFSYLLPTRIR